MALEDSQTYLRRLLEFKESPLSITPSLPTESESQSPLQLLDRHIPDHLLLKRITIVPSLASDIANVTDAYYDDIAALSAEKLEWIVCKPKKSEAGPMAVARGDGLGMVCSSIATSVVVNPGQPGNDFLMMWDARREMRPPYNDHLPFVVENSTLLFNDIDHDPDMLEPLSEATRETMVNLRDHSRYLVTGLFFSLQGRSLLEDMSALVQDEFPWSLNSKCSKPHIPGAPGGRPPDVDAEDSLWNLPLSSDTLRPSSLRRSTRLTEAGDVAWTRVPVSGDITPIPHLNVFDKTYKPMARDYIQRAWANAVRVDSSVIIFDCGTALRVGIRHRATQTLFLTELLDLATSENPTFGKFYTGLHLAAAHDSLKRLPLKMNRKRPRDGDEYHLPVKRRKTSNHQNGAEMKAQLHLRNSNIIAAYFRHRQHDSPAPILLFSDERGTPGSAYRPKDYVKLVLDERLGAGATGEALTALIQPDASSRSPKYSPLVFKMATDAERIERLIHESKIYTQLEAAGVEGIPRSLGIWQDSQRNICALILTNAGHPLGDRLDEEQKVTLTPMQAASLRETLKSIHKAGVLHRDLRSWNMLVDGFDRVFITDFDRSSLNASATEYRFEVERLEKFLSGGYVDRDPIIGYDEKSEGEASP
ncbi:hypothetical protein BDZ89DRAFT_1157159 [Hymenopellis radicata]|nr:hypothetical protein BDZ89DRAFT_1157159 [Hymenopellis radicata]